MEISIHCRVLVTTGYHVSLHYFWSKVLPLKNQIKQGGEGVSSMRLRNYLHCSELEIIKYFILSVILHLSISASSYSFFLFFFSPAVQPYHFHLSFQDNS